MDLEIEILTNMKVEWERHAKDCDQSPKAFLLNRGNHELLGWDESLGVPVLPDDRVEPMRCRLLCGMGRGGSCAEGEVFWDSDGRPYIFEVAEDQD